MSAGESRPLVVLIHGGGWRRGNKKSYRPHAAWFANRGFATATIEYRLSGEARFPAAIKDCKAAISWLRGHASQFGYDPNRIALFGGSAGAHLAALAATTGDRPEFGETGVSNAVQMAIVVSGPTDITSQESIEDYRKPDSNYRLFLGGTYDEVPRRYQQASPAHYVNQKTPPMLIFGEHSVKSSETIRTLLKDAGVPYQTFILTGGLHGCWNWEPWFQVTMKRSEMFLK